VSAAVSRWHLDMQPNTDHIGKILRRQTCPDRPMEQVVVMSRFARAMSTARGAGASADRVLESVDDRRIGDLRITPVSMILSRNAEGGWGSTEPAEKSDWRGSRVAASAHPNSLSESAMLQRVLVKCWFVVDVPIKHNARKSSQPALLAGPGDAPSSRPARPTASHS